MSKQAPELFVTEYEKRIRHTFQRHGNKLLKTVRNKDPKGKEKVILFVAGTGEAVERPARHQDIPFMNAGRSKVELNLKAYFAGDPVDWEDLESMELDDTQTIADQAAMALGRKVDDIIVQEMNGTSITLGDGSEPFSLRAHLATTERAAQLNWHEEEGTWFHLVGPNAWSHLMTYKQFTSADYISSENLPFLNRQNSRNFEGVTYIKYNGLASPGANRERSLLYLGPAIAAAGEPAGSDITWAGGQKQRWEIMDKVRAGCKRHEADAVIAFDHATNIPVENAFHAALSA